MNGKTLNDLDLEISGSSTWNPKATGWAGIVIHRWFTDDDNDSAPDLPLVPHPELNHKGLEIKVIPLDYYSDGRDQVKWPQSLAMINFKEIHDSYEPEGIEDSVLFRKDRWTLVVYYRYNKTNRPSGRILGVGIWNIEALLFNNIADDYNLILQYIRDGRAVNLSETLTNFLSARTKSSSSKNRRSAGEGAIPAKPRTWALKSRYIRKRMEIDGIDFKIRPDWRPDETVDSDRDIHEFIVSNLTGKSVLQVANEIGQTKIQSKDVGRIVATKALHRRPGGLGKRGGARTRYISGKLLKVFSVNDDLKPTEGGVRLPHVPLVDLVEETWESSSLFEEIGDILMIPMLKKKPLTSSIFLQPVLYKPSKIELEEIKVEWELFTNEIRDGKAKRLVRGGKNVHLLSKKQETKYLHMRPCGKDGTVTELDGNGNRCTKMALWLNDSFVQSIIKGILN